jgi:hypothetical protein
MTNEEIEKVAVEYLRANRVHLIQDSEPDHEEIQELALPIRALVIQAYEEAARRADFHQDKCGNDDRFYCPGEVAKEIRSLKDSLIQPEQPAPSSEQK